MEMVSFLTLIRLGFLLLSISVIISSNTINIFCYLIGFYSSIFSYIYHAYHSSIQQKIRVFNIQEYSTFEYSTLEPLKYFKPVLSGLLINN